MSGFLWVLLSLAVVAKIGTLVIWRRLAAMPKKGQSGSELIAIGLRPVFLSAYVIEFVGGASGIVLATWILDTPAARVVTGVLGAILFGHCLLQLVWLGWQALRI